jgi:HK97 family phage portal protein
MLLEFLGLSRRSLENPRVSLSDVEAWNELFGTSDTDSGVAMSHAKALTYSPVWQGVSLLSGDVAKLPLSKYKRLEGKEREEDTKHKAQRIVRWRANSEMTAFRFWRRLMVHAILWNRAYAWIDRDGAGRPLEMIPLLPDRTAPMRYKGQLYYVTEVAGKPKPYLAADVFVIEGIMIEEFQDCDMAKNARHSFALGLAAEKFSSRFFKHGVRTGGILELPAGMRKPARDTVEEGFTKHHEGADNWFKTVVLRDGAKFHQTSIPPGEAQMLETRREQVREVARWLNLPPHKLGDDSKSSYNSLESENQSYLDGTLSHWLQTISAECWAKLLSPAEQESNRHFFEHNTKALLRSNTLQRHQIYRLGIEAGIYSPDECRAFENLNPRPDGKGGQYRMPLNMTTGGDQPAKNDPAPDGQPAETDTESAKPDADEQDRALQLALRQVLTDAVGRMLRRVTIHAKKVARTNGTLDSWLAAELPGHRDVVRQALSPAVAAIAAARGGDDDEHLTRSVDLFFRRAAELLAARDATTLEASCTALESAETALVDAMLTF